MSDVDGCHQYVAYQPTTEERAAQGVPEERFKYPINGLEMTVHVGRGLNLTFDTHSLELVHQISTHKSQMSSVRGGVLILSTCETSHLPSDLFLDGRSCGLDYLHHSFNARALAQVVRAQISHLPNIISV